MSNTHFGFELTLIFFAAWGGDDDDDKEKPKTPSELAKAVVEFEGKIAAATLDLWVRFTHYPTWYLTYITLH